MLNEWRTRRREDSTMQRFCSNCGTSQPPSAVFCQRCGAQLAAAPTNQPPAQTVQPQRPPASAGGSGLKIAMIVLVCLAVVGVGAVAGIYYVVHRVKQAVVQKAAEYGVDLPSAKTSSEPSAKRTSGKTCDLLSAQEASSLLGEPIEREQTQDDACMYYGPPGLSVQLAKAQASDTLHHAEAPGAKVDGSEVTNAVDQLVNSLGAAAGQTGSNGELPLLILVVGDDGPTQMEALTATQAIFSGIGNAGGAKNIMGGAVPGLGDKAIRLPKLGLNVLRGQTIIRVVAGPVPDADAKTIQIAREVLTRI
jgi:zinc-ribbon domain